MLAAAVLLVVPLVNALVLEAQETADRQVRDTPADRPPEPAARDGPSPNATGNRTSDRPGESVSARSGGNCTPVPEEEPVVRWRHPAPQDSPGAAAQARLEAPETQGFRISPLHPAARVQLEVSSLTGYLLAQVYPDGAGEGAAPFSFEGGGNVSDDVTVGRTLTRTGPLSTGDWVATLETDYAAYEELAFTVVRAICQEGSS